MAKPHVVYEYNPETGKLPGMSFEEQTEDFLNDLSYRVETAGNASEIAQEALDKANDAQNKVNNLEGIVNGHTTIINQHTQQLTTIEGKLVDHEGRIVALEENDVVQDTAIGNLQNENAAQDAQLDNLDERVTVLEGSVGGFDGRITAVEESVVDLGNRVNSVENTVTEVVSNVAELETRVSTVETDLDAKANIGLDNVSPAALDKLVPAGGVANQVLGVVSTAPQRVLGWVDQTGGGGGGSSTLSQAVLYMNATALALQETEPTSASSTPFVLSQNNVPVSATFTYSNAVELSISPTASYGAWCYFSGLNNGTQYRLDGEWRLPGQSNFVVSNGSVTFTATGTTELMFIPMNTNFLTDNRAVPAFQGIQLVISLRRTSGGNHTVSLNTGPANVSAFVRNGGDISTSNVYGLYSGATLSQTAINAALKAVADQAYAKAEEALAGGSVKLMSTPELSFAFTEMLLDEENPIQANLGEYTALPRKKMRVTVTPYRGVKLVTNGVAVTNPDTGVYDVTLSDAATAVAQILPAQPTYNPGETIYVTAKSVDALDNLSSPALELTRQLALRTDIGTGTFFYPMSSGTTGLAFTSNSVAFTRMNMGQHGVGVIPGTALNSYGHYGAIKLDGKLLFVAGEGSSKNNTKLRVIGAQTFNSALFTAYSDPLADVNKAPSLGKVQKNVVVVNGLLHIFYVQIQDVSPYKCGLYYRTFNPATQVFGPQTVVVETNATSYQGSQPIGAYVLNGKVYAGAVMPVGAQWRLHLCVADVAPTLSFTTTVYTGAAITDGSAMLAPMPGGGMMLMYGQSSPDNFFEKNVYTFTGADISGAWTSTPITVGGTAITWSPDAGRCNTFVVGSTRYVYAGARYNVAGHPTILTKDGGVTWNNTSYTIPDGWEKLASSTAQYSDGLCGFSYDAGVNKVTAMTPLQVAGTTTRQMWLYTSDDGLAFTPLAPFGPTGSNPAYNPQAASGNFCGEF